MVVNFTPVNEVSSTASVAKKAWRTSGLSRIEMRALRWTSWKKMISGVFGPSRTRSRMSLARSAGSVEKWSMSQDARVNVGLTCFCAILGNVYHPQVAML